MGIKEHIVAKRIRKTVPLVAELIKTRTSTFKEGFDLGYNTADKALQNVCDCVAENANTIAKIAVQVEPVINELVKCFKELKTVLEEEPNRADAAALKEESLKAAIGRAMESN